MAKNSFHREAENRAQGPGMWSRAKSEIGGWCLSLESWEMFPPSLSPHDIGSVVTGPGRTGHL